MTGTVDEFQRAYHQVAKRDWPPLDELAAAARRYELVVGQVRRNARPRHFDDSPATPADPVQTRAPEAEPCSRTAAKAAPHTTHHFDHKRAASGERPDDDE